MPPQETIEKLPPQSLEAEMAVLGSMLLDREATALAIEMLNQSYFYKDAHKKIYSAIIKLFDENRAVDLITVVEELKTFQARLGAVLAALEGQEALKDTPRQYLNRLSDLMFVLARVLNRHRTDGTVGDDVYWKSAKLAQDAAA